MGLGPAKGSQDPGGKSSGRGWDALRDEGVRDAILSLLRKAGPRVEDGNSGFRQEPRDRCEGRVIVMLTSDSTIRSDPRPYRMARKTVAEDPVS